jgi:hypothetical protein
MYGIVQCLNVRDNKALVGFKFIGVLIKIKPFFDFTQDSLGAALLFDLYLQSGNRVFAFGYFYGLQLHIGIGAAKPFGGNTLDRDLLHQLLIVGIESIQTVDSVVYGFVSSGVPQYHQWVKLFE